jgi:peptidoglycan/xylan/chitin deacetylase (PgdA/CDA1 family)
VSRIPILCYHSVGEPPPGSRFGLLYVNPAKLERQLWAIRRLGLRGVSMGEGLSRLRDKTRSDVVVLTFDDGYVDTLTEAAPLLARYGFRATSYVVSDGLGGYNRWDDTRTGERHALMTAEQVGAWLAYGMEIGSHSRSHPVLPALSRGEAEAEIGDSRAALERSFGVAIEHFAYPFGQLCARTVQLTRRAGYRSAVTMQPGVAGSCDDAHRLPRLFVDGTRGLGRFLLEVGTPYVDLRAGRGFLLR